MASVSRPSSLADSFSDYPFTYLVTVNEKMRSHVVPVTAELRAGEVIVSGVGKRSLANVAFQESVSLVSPPTRPDGYSLIIDGDAKVVGDDLQLTLTRAVLHRSSSVQGAQSNPSGGCTSDCVELSFGKS